MLRRKFLWGGSEEKDKINWVAWDVVLGSKDKGGLGVGSLYSLNLSLLLKWLWRFKNEHNSIWRREVCGIHNGYRKPVIGLEKKTLPGVWFRIIKAIPELVDIGFELSSIFEIKVGSGENTLFWLDDWLGGGDRLMPGFLCSLIWIKKKTCFVADRMAPNKLLWDWKKFPRNPTEISELCLLSDLVKFTTVSEAEDKWRSKLSGDGVYYVHDLRRLIDDKVTIPTLNPTIWLLIIPLKINCFIWRACMDRIPSAVNLARRGINVGNTSCALCNLGTDEADHFLINCPSTATAMGWIFNWCGIPIQPFSSVSDFINFAANWGHCPKKRRIFIVICYGLLWCTWKARNDLVFNKVHISLLKMADSVVTMVFSFIAHRGNFGKINWANWLSCPFNIL
ncbi:hypothetical protein OSB04_015212 [Centaurea solstitialis]|uniref:Reverse transcriptase zinc-binding domain-containing protein n=1 Tax=Centaurea solstitialis TaxID=347529 RepID=A0AA38W784_9ASTR|nr:hypothetical protein OSB04_015212 [Centaurea solstitialis]